MKKETKERTPEELAALEKDNQRQYALVAFIAWTVCFVLCVALVVMDLMKEAVLMQILFHGACGAGTLTAAVIQLLRWRRSKRDATE